MLDAERALGWTALVTAAATALATLEILSRREWLADGHLLNWPASRLRARFLATGRSGAAADRLLETGVFLVLLRIRLVLALAVPFTDGRLRGVLLAALAVLFGLWALRSPYGQDGADQMTLVLTISVATADLVASPAARQVAAAFIAAQLTLSYFVAGMAKAASPVWRSGDALLLIFRTRIYGHPWIHDRLRASPGLAVAGCWGVFLLETAFPAWLVTPFPVGLTLGAGLLLFHLGAAALMGLNTFLVAFAGGYPCWLWALATWHAAGSPGQ